MASTDPASAAGTEGSRAGLVAGGTYTVDQLFSGLLLVSGNDTAMALSEAAGGGHEEDDRERTLHWHSIRAARRILRGKRRGVA